MYHSITIGEKNTWTDWHLIPQSRPLVAPPPVTTKYVTVPGSDGSIDLSELLTGAPSYQNRTGSWSFIVAPNYWTWVDAYQTISNYLHGNELKVILEDDPSYYYEGRLELNAWQSGSNFSTITINYTLSPYKKHVGSDSWEWDTFDFENGVIETTLSELDYSIDGTKEITIDWDRTLPAALAVTCSAPMTMTVNGGHATALYEGENCPTGVKIVAGSNTVILTGTGTAKFELTERSL